MRVFLTVVALVVIAGAVDVSKEFHDWKLKYGKSYSSEEEESQRKMIWLDNLKLVLEHNLLADQGLKSYRLGMNHFADMSHQEYQEKVAHCLGALNETELENESTLLQEEEGAVLPRNVDWRTRGYVTRVKDQSHCGSCWAFSAVGALEGQIFKKRKILRRLSEQQLVDCSWGFGNHGCNGGWPHRAYSYIMASGGLETESSYPYKARDGRCKFRKQKALAKCYGAVRVSPRERCLKNAVAKNGPVSVAIDASRRTFQLYKSGVYDDPTCSSTRLNHAVLVVGYGTASRRKDYWLVKNSWGTSWGLRGYIKMSRNNMNQCGIARYGVFPRV